MSKPSCPLQAQRCGGCPQLSVPYAGQLAAKQRRAEALFAPLAPVAPILGAADPWHYRNKAIASFAEQRGRLTAGIYAAGTHRVLPLPESGCLLQAPILDRTIAAVVQTARALRWPAYREDQGTGLLRHVLVRWGHATNQVLVVLVTAADRLPGSRQFVAALRRAAPWVTTVVHNCNLRRTSAVLGRQVRVLYGPGQIEDTLCGLTFALSAGSFYQVNPAQTERLYDRALAYAELSGRPTVLDAYCGIGTIGLVAAKHGAGQVLGVEVNPDAVKDAIQNAKENEVKNAYFTCGDAGEFLEEAALQGERWDVVFMDPPRAGASREFLTALCACGPKRVVYISCDPETLSRDLGILQANHYQIEAIQPVDMFPHTQHIECVVRLTRKGETGNARA